MGRKKIEIQPITHERNRSVTFLKRKNGLFKKAYELGVLCSVDVAVIIFEERSGHHLKLYQYSSKDINDIVQRHQRHDGEQDHKGPADFSNNNNAKPDDIGDDIDEDGDEEDDIPGRSKRGRDGKLKPSPDMQHITGMDYTHRNLAIPQTPFGIGSQNAAQSLPISSDRLSNMRNSTTKRGRIESNNPHSRSPSDDPSNGTSYYHPHSSGAQFASSRQSAGYHHHPSHQGNPQYTPFFSPQGPPSFIPPGSAGISSRNSGYSLSHHGSTSGSAPYDSIYPNIMGRSGSTNLTNSTSANSGGNLFPPFIDTDEQGRHQSHSQTQQTGFGLEWPVHAAGNTSSSNAHSSLPEPVSNPPPPSTDNSGQSSTSHWIDFLSSTNSASSSSTAREIMSWERGGPPGSSSSDMYVERGGGGGGGGGRTGTAGSPLIPGIVHAGKRSPAGLLTSPLTGNSSRDEKEISSGQ